MTTIIEVNNLVTHFGDKQIHDELDLIINKNEINAIIGGSGSGKTTLFKCILQLIQPTSGGISIFGKNTADLSQDEIFQIKKRWGVLFQNGALYSSLTIRENIYFPMKEFLSFTKSNLEELMYWRLEQVGLSPDVADKYPAELSGGMVKRAALARAIALEPELLFLDEPTSGLDPNSSERLEELILSLRDNLDLTVLMITHDLDTLWHITDRVAYISSGKVLSNSPISQLVELESTELRDYFSSKRAQIHYKNS